MKQFVIFFSMAIVLSSCLKESIADAMWDKQNGIHGGSPAVATITYAVNGNTVNFSVNNPDKQSPNSYQLGCSKTPVGINSSVYYLSSLSESGELTFMFPTDTLTVGNYNYPGNYGDLFVLSYNGTNEFLHVISDSMSFNITSSANGHISGNFSGCLTPMIMAGNPYNTYGPSGSALITNGSFKDIPVFY
jgi:hypothetical protein